MRPVRYNLRGVAVLDSVQYSGIAICNPCWSSRLVDEYVLLLRSYWSVLKHARQARREIISLKRRLADARRHI